MKKIRIALTALILGASLTAFTKAHQQKNEDLKTWYYKLDIDDEDAYNTVTNYQDSSITGFPGCNSADDVLCSIKAEDDGNNHPVLDPMVPVTKNGTEYQQTRRDFNDPQ